MHRVELIGVLVPVADEEKIEDARHVHRAQRRVHADARPIGGGEVRERCGTRRRVAPHNRELVVDRSVTVCFDLGDAVRIRFRPTEGNRIARRRVGDAAQRCYPVRAELGEVRPNLSAVPALARGRVRS